MAWTLVTNYGGVVVYLDEHPTARLREIADAIGVTERRAQAIVTELVRSGYLTRERIGRRNHYTVVTDALLRDPLLARHTLRDLLSGLTRELCLLKREAGSG
jgi:DNA-binding MarR family transcriptional regulator